LFKINGGKNKKILKIFLVLTFFIFFTSLIINSAYALTNASLSYTNGSLVDYFRYDWKNSEIGDLHYGSNSYMDYSKTNPNVWLNLCHPNLNVGDKIDFVHMSENGSIIASTLNFLPQVVSTTNYTTLEDYECTNIDIDFSSIYSVFPGYIYPVIVPENIDYSRDNYDLSEIDILTNYSFLFNGSYELGVDVVGPPKKYIITVSNVYDENQTEFIDIANTYMWIMSLINSSNETLTEKLVKPGQYLPYEGNFVGGEQVYVNGISSLEIINYDPCTPINSSGYYIMNDTAWNLNQTCVIINNSQNIVINFVNEIIAGDGNLTFGSKKEDECAVVIQNSQNIVLENFKAQEFYYGVCIKNSTTKVFGTAASYNLHGAKIEGGSVVNLVDVYFGNNNSEIYSIEDSQVNLTHVNFSTADVKSNFKNIMVRSVQDPPDLPDIENIQDISQYIEYISTQENSIATMGFYYGEPLPNNMSLGNISIYQRHGERVLHNETNTTYYFNATLNQTVNITTNIETYEWEDGNWTELDTLIAPAVSTILHGNPNQGIITITNFSVFAPLGFPNSTDTQEEPTPEPEPKPKPKPSGGGGSGGGGTPQDSVKKEVPLEADPEVIELELVLIDKNITLTQGEPGEIRFNISNKGDIFVESVVVGPEVSRGWDYTNYTIELLPGGGNAIGTFQIAPYEKSVARDYYIQVRASVIDDDKTIKLVSETLKVKVLPRGNLARLRVLEYPPEVLVNPFSKLDISFLTENIGDLDLPNVSIKLEPSDCILDIQGDYDLDWKETKSMNYQFSFGDKSICDYNIKFYSNEDLVGFLPIKFVVRQKTWRDEPVKTSIVLLMIIGWTVLTAWIIAKKRKYKSPPVRGL